jgi:hypothetical protein
MCKGKGKGHPITGHEGPQGEQRYSSTLSLSSALHWGGWSTPRPGRFTPGKETRYPLYRRLGGPKGQSGWLQKISPPPGTDPQTFQPVASFIKSSLVFYNHYNGNNIYIYINKMHVAYNTHLI